MDQSKLAALLDAVRKEVRDANLNSDARPGVAHVATMNHADALAQALAEYTGDRADREVALALRDVRAQQEADFERMFDARREADTMPPYAPYTSAKRKQLVEALVERARAATYKSDVRAAFAELGDLWGVDGPIREADYICGKSALEQICRERGMSLSWPTLKAADEELARERAERAERES
jgi:hypothetical protein